MSFLLALALAVNPAASGSTTDGERAPSAILGDLRAVGDVKLRSSCGSEAQAVIERATALLHSFFYDEARRLFEEAARKEPGCALAHWGVAMTRWHPIWTPPSAEEREAGRAAIERARTLGGRHPIERGLIAALGAYYLEPPPAAGSGEASPSCHGLTGGADHAARAQAYEKAMARLYAEHADDVEVASFYALALLATAPPTDAQLTNPTRATQILERFFATQPNHPGVIHYLIHGYDYPQVAERGLVAARAYAKVAPWVPHALHMPSHIFTRLGMWPDVIDSNRASADAARQNAARSHPEAHDFEELHSLDYMIYAYLQRGEDERAAEVLKALREVRATWPAADFAAAYALGAAPARYALERRAWGEAAALAEPRGASVEKYTFGLAHVAFARALGAARTGRVADARAALARLEQLGAGMTDPRLQYFAKQAAMQLQAVRGFVAFAEGQGDEAERLLRGAADTDDALGKHPVSPGSLLPARELLADLLLARGKPQAALAEYERCLALNRGRLNSLYGAGLAAERAGDPTAARRHYATLVGMVADGAPRAEIVHAREFLAAARASEALAPASAGGGSR